MGISHQGVQVGSQPIITWDTFNGYSPTDQAAILASAGVPQNEITPTLSALNAMEQDQYKQYLLDKFGDNPNIWFQLTPDQQNILAHAAPGNQPPPSDPYTASGLAGVINATAGQAQKNTALGLTPGGQQPQNQALQPVFSQQNIKDYVTNYLVPEEQAMYGSQGPIASEIGAVEKSMGAVASAAGQAGSPITQIMKGTVAGLLPLQQQYGKDALTAATIGPLLQLLNNAISAPAAIGAKEQALGTNFLNLGQYYASDPQIQAAVGQAGGTGLAGTGGVSGLLGLLPGSSAPNISGTGITPTTPTG